MRALTLKAHWAHCVAHLGKPIENRNQPVPPKFIGRRIAIHAGTRQGMPKDWSDEIDFASGMTLIERNNIYGYMRVMDTALHMLHTHPTEIHTRCIVATAVIERCVAPYEPAPRWGNPEAGWWWMLRKVRPLEHVVPVYRGQLGFWTLPDSVVQQIDMEEIR